MSPGDITRLVAIGCGIVVLFVGLLVLVKVVGAALALYQDPARIERLAAHIERGSNLDHNLAPRDPPPPPEASPETGQDPAEETSPEARPGLRLSYFVAWIIEFLLLLLIARIGLGAIATGGRLALSWTRD